MLRSYMRRTGFRRQLTVISILALLGMSLFSALFNTYQAHFRMRGFILEQTARTVDNLARRSAQAMQAQAPFNAQDEVEAAFALPAVLRVEVADLKRAIVFGQNKDPLDDISALLARSPAPSPQTVPRAGLEWEDNDAWLFTAPVIEIPAANAAATAMATAQDSPPQVLLGYARIMVGKAAFHQLLWMLLLVNLAISLAVAAVLLLAMRVVVRHMMDPLSRLSALMQRFEDGESGLRATPDGPNDIRDMALAFNKMMAVLDERDAALKVSHDDAVGNALLKAQFATTVSHEVRTPLNGVVGMLELLKDMRLTKRQQECVDIAWSSSQALIALINDILDFSKMEAGKLDLEEIDFDLRRLVEDILTLLAKPAQQKNLALGYLMDADVPDRIVGDSLRLRQVLLNLVGNAIKFTERGEVAVRIGCIGDAVAVAGDGAATPFGLRFDVIDTGVGMTPEAIRTAFDAFSQADRSTTRKFGGTGLGLAICRQLVRLMSGDIGILSERARGSTFWFTVRCKSGANSGAAPFAPLQNMQAMLIGSGGIVRDFLFHHLTEQGMRCTLATTPTDAVQELMRIGQDTHPYQLLVMEIDNATGSGADLVRRLRADSSANAPRLLLLDRYGKAADETASAHEAVLEKPLRRQALFDAATQLLSGQPTLAPVNAPPQPLMHLTTRPIRVLVAEDNRTNQMVAAGMLAMNGCYCEFAGNGLEAVEAARTRHFDLILMDCSMPEMDGYEATANIRNFEEPLGRRTPIVAMTANTQPGDFEKCLSAGMDDYMAKPITLIELRHKLDRWIAHDAGPAPHDAGGREIQDGPLDMVVFQKLQDVLGPALPQAVVPFLEDTQTYMTLLEQALQRGDAAVVSEKAHAIKGSSGNLGAVEMAQLAKQIEDMANADDLQDVAPLLPLMRRAFDAVAAALGSKVAQHDGHDAGDGQERPLVLVVEDDRSTRSALRHTLQREGFRVEEAEDGAQALQALKRLQPDVILMDAMMPVMDGFTACARLQEMPNGRAIPVLMITALEDNQSVERAFAAGASDYIPKPIHFAVLSQRVRRIIDGSRAEKRIRHMAYNDLLTGLPNRLMFVDHLGLALEHARKEGEAIAVVFLDLDRFKNVNDTLGHDVGDHLLIAVAQRLRRTVRSNDCVARLGGDEFTIMMADVDAGNAAGAAQNICRALAAPFEIDGHDIFVTASVGISLYPNDGTDVGTLLKHADTAMYRAKKTRTGFQFFEAAMEHSISERMRLETDLRHALERKELEVHYQPQVRLVSGRVVGMEALVRWRHPLRGMVPPAEFIPLAEETGLINALGGWVLHTACAQVQSWVAGGAQELKVAVNLSVHQLLQKDFAATVEQVLQETGLAPHLLELEITESTLMEHAEDTLAALHRLRELGIRLSIDDFGTGYSSLAYLKRFPVDIIKIDRSFVRDVCEDVDDASIVNGIIVLAHSLRLEVVAEGVETAAQLAFLREKSCDMMQGYYLSPAVPADQFVRFIEHGAPLTAADSQSVIKLGPLIL